MKNYDYFKQMFEAEDAENEQETTGNGTDGAKTYTEQELNSLIDKAVTSRLARERQAEEKRSKAAAEAARLEKLTTEQKLQEKADALQKKIDELERKETLAAMGASARKILNDEKVILSDEIISVLIADDAETTQKNVNAFLKSYKQAVADGVADQLRGKTPKSGNKPTMTKDEIRKIPDPIERQRRIQENISLFKHGGQ